MWTEAVAPLLSARIHYIASPNTGPAVVFVHGLGDSLESYLPILPALIPSYQVFAFDLRGHGQSSHHPGHYHIYDHVADLCAFLQQIVARPAIVAGHSLGGNVAAYAATQAPALMRGLVLEDPPLLGIHGDPEAIAFFSDLRTQIDRFAAQDDPLMAFATTLAGSPFGTEHTRVDVFGTDGVQRHARQWLQMDRTHLDALVDGSMWDGYTPEQILPAIACPAHLITCPEEFGGIWLADVVRIRQLIPHCTTTEVPDVSHRIHELKPDAYLQNLKPFLAMLS